MNYTCTTKDYGQGSGLTVMPVSKHAGKKMPLDTRPYSAYEVLTDYFEEDMSCVLGNYVNMEIETIHDAGIMRQAQTLRLLSYYYKGTRSRIQQSTSETVVDFIIQGKVAGLTGKKEEMRSNIDFRVRYILDLKPCSQRCIGPIINLYQGDDEYLQQYPITTNEFLLPILYAKDYELVAHDMLFQYFPEAERNLMNGSFHIQAEELAQRMGLEIQNVHFMDPSVLGQLYYNRGNVQVRDDHGRVINRTINPGTILLSIDNCTTEGIRNSTIVHECSHMYLDRWFFLLQMMAGNKTAAYTNRRKEKKGSFASKTPVEWMELQCEKLPAYLMMERQSTIKYVESLKKRSEIGEGALMMRNIISSAAEYFHVSFAMAKYRLIELGYREAEGINCYLDGTIIPDHGCSGSWPEGITYTISVDEALKLQDRNRRFAELVSSGRFRYVEGHFCKNSRKYLEFDRNGRIRLTGYARQHMNECCLGFQKYGWNKNSQFQLGCAARNKTDPVTDKYCSGYELAAEPGTEKYEKENDNFSEDCWLWGDFFYDMSDDYKDAILDIMKRKGVTQEALAMEMNVDRKMIYKCLNAINPSKPHLVAICVALKLPSFVSEKILANAGITFRRNDLDHLYRAFLLRAEQLTVERCDDILTQKNLPTLFERAA